MKKRVLMALLLATLTTAASAETVSINIDVDKPGVKINPRMYGIFLEEINHGVDGGLYGEMIQNRGFEDAKPPEGFTYQQPASRRGSGFRGADANGGKWVNPGGYATTFVWEADKSLPYWSLVQDKGGKGSMTLDMANPLNAETPRSCKLQIDAVGDGGRVGIANEGYWGVGIKEGEKYDLTFYARCAAGFSGMLAASLENGGAAESDVVKVDGVGAEWKQFHAVLTASKTDGKAKFVLAVVGGAGGGTGMVWLDMVSLFPARTFKDRPNGLRQDIAQMIADLKPGFVRFPGGCVVEAATVETAYNWKNTLGPVERRPEVWNAWDYRRTHGMGLYEYLQFIEDIGATPMYVSFAGQTCIYRAPALVPLEQMQPIVESYTDLVEYANGPADSKWGKMRAEAGHAAPFHLGLIEIGNENTGQAYSQRYGLIFPALKAKYPDIQTIADLAVRGQTVEMIDEHHYADPNWFFNNTHLYDDASRAMPLYLGEVAVTSGQGVRPERGNLLAALAEGAYLMGAERNADVVKMVSYAPLLANVDGRTELAGAPPPWHGMIYFDSTRTFGTVSYYLWKMFGQNVPTVNLATTATTANAVAGMVGNVGVGTWGTSAEFKDIKVEGKDGKVLYASDFAQGEAGTSGWSNEAGRWSVVDGALRQSANTNGFAYVGDPTWTDYTISLKARKLTGGEGFLVIFGHKGSDRYWWNIGGYGNTRHEIEMNQAVQGRAVNGQIEANRWYDLKVQVEGLHVRTWMDGQLINDVQVQGPPPAVQAIAGRDEVTGDIVVKVINRSGQAATGAINLAGVPTVEPRAKLTMLTSGALQDNNSLDAPLKVAPVEKEFTVAGPRFEYELPAYSLTVLRLKTRP